MEKFIFWYKKEIMANDIRSAVQKEPKAKHEFSSIEVVDRPNVEIIQGASAIGFHEEI